MKVKFENIIREHQDRLYRMCRSAVFDPQYAEDLYQEVLINIWKALKRFRGEASLTTYLYRIVINTAITFNRKEKRRSQAMEKIRRLPQQVDAFTEQADQRLANLNQAIHQLPEEERWIIGMYLDSLSYKEIASVLGSNTNYVGVKINRIKKKLEKLIKLNTNGR
ncbi:MAG: RNA polymerase sigma factor [Bacteroidota bacterium]